MTVKHKYIYELVGGPKKFRKQKRLKRVVIVSAPRSKSATITAEWYKRLCEDFRQERLRQNISQQTLSNKVGLPQSWISNFENGKVCPTLVSLLTFADALNLRIELKIK